jgi:hypothetical protein
MTRLSFSLLTVLLLQLTSLSAYDSSDYDQAMPVGDQYSKREIREAEEAIEEKPAVNPLITFPYEVKANYDFISRSKITNKRYKKQKIGFGEGEVATFYNILCNKDECLIFGLGYTFSHLYWRKDIKFDQLTFDNLAVSVGGYTTRFHKWLWQGGVSVEIDTRRWNLNDYSLYNFLLWGRYSYRENIGLHIGAVLRTGLEQVFALPIIGFDWEFCKQWKLSVIYPVDISLNYNLNEHWSLTLAGRIWNSRHRLGGGEDDPRSIIEYRNRGVELGVTYHYTALFTANLHGGVTGGGGNLKVMNRHGNHARFFCFDSAGYVGGAVDIRF